MSSAIFKFVEINMKHLLYIFVLKMAPASYVCSIYSSAHQTRFYHRSKQYAPLVVDRPRSYKTFFMLNSTEHEISTAHRQIKKCLALSLSDVFIMLLNVKMPTIFIQVIT